MTPADFKCPRRIGYLFPHPCDRATLVDCPDCQDGRLDDPYTDRTDRYTYTDYDDYGVLPAGAAMEFTEADGEHLLKPRRAFEDDLTAS